MGYWTLGGAASLRPLSSHTSHGSIVRVTYLGRALPRREIAPPRGSLQHTLMGYGVCEYV
eukprot:6407118-Heterocapsa_arctica.AAC.1